jgi:hypothetical protein
MFQVQSQSWMLTTAAAEAGCRPVPVRHCAAAAPAGDSVVVIGGGALCFSFGSTFSRPCTLHLPRSCPTASSSPAASAIHEAVTPRSSCSRLDTSRGMPVAAEPGIMASNAQHSESSHPSSAEVQQNGRCTEVHQGAEMNGSCLGSPRGDNKGQNGMCEKGSWALVVPRQEAKGFKDALKSAEGLNRKNHSLVCDGGASIALPVTDACAKNLLSATGQGQGIIRNGKELGSPRMIAEAIAEGRLKVCRMPLAGAKVLRSPRERLVQTAHQLLSMAGI